MAAIIRASDLIISLPPTRVNPPSCKTRSNRVWASGGISPISSRKSVPPLAWAKRPSMRRSAPVNAPFSWPKSSDSIKSRGMAAILSATNGPFLRKPRSWSARATTSLPVPLSPVIITDRSVETSLAMDRKISCMAGDWPINWSCWSSPNSISDGAVDAEFKAEVTVSTNVSNGKGFGK